MELFSGRHNPSIASNCPSFAGRNAPSSREIRTRPAVLPSMCFLFTVPVFVIQMAKKSYQEVVRGIRTAKDPTMYISEVLTEIRQEIRGTDRNDKVISLQKLIYLNLLGYNFDWAVPTVFAAP